jgi:hypothetical protein
MTILDQAVREAGRAIERDRKRGFPVIIKIIEAISDALKRAAEKRRERREAKRG